MRRKVFQQKKKIFLFFYFFIFKGSFSKKFFTGPFLFIFLFFLSLLKCKEATNDRRFAVKEDGGGCVVLWGFCVCWGV
jgi:hypothetical protein